MIRPIVAGQFYAEDPNVLKKQIESCFLSKFGPNALPGERKAKRLIGVLVPHAGYAFSGAAAAWAYKRIAESKFPKRFVILAPDHNGICYKPTTTTEDFQTPFGVVKTDKDFVEKLLKKCSFLKTGTIMEHAVEVQLPFLQYACKDIEKVRIVPIVVPSAANYDKLGAAMAETDENCYIISSDFTHYGFAYGYVPFTENARQNIEKIDRKAIEYITALDAKNLLRYVESIGATICGVYAIATGIEAIKAKGKKGELLAYYTSGDVTGDYTNSVGYAAIEFV